MLHPKLTIVLAKTQELIHLAEVVARTTAQLGTLQIKAISAIAPDHKMQRAIVDLLEDCGLVKENVETDTITWIHPERN